MRKHGSLQNYLHAIRRILPSSPRVRVRLSYSVRMSSALTTETPIFPSASRSTRESDTHIKVLPRVRERKVAARTWSIGKISPQEISESLPGEKLHQKSKKSRVNKKRKDGPFSQNNKENLRVNKNRKVGKFESRCTRTLIHPLINV